MRRMKAQYDLIVAGGGINGAAIARDAAGRGLRVLLVEQHDLASHTSSASTKLIHGGLRYLEQYEFRLVAEALAERERLMAAAPHLIRPLRFALPHAPGMRPGWMMRIGLFLYDRLGGRSRLPRSLAARFAGTPYGAPLRDGVTRGYLYSDCWGDDSRLVVACTQDAAARGADIATRTRIDHAERVPGGWDVRVTLADGETRAVRARALVNATGGWAQRFLAERTSITAHDRVRLVKGSHIVTRRLFDGDHAYLLQNPDKRVIFAIPYEDRFTLIGTTDVPWDGPLDEVAIDAAETDYLCAAVNRWFATPITPDDVVWSYAGLRPLHDDAEANPSEVSRDYVLALDTADGGAPLLSVFGGKITTHRALAEHAMDRLRAHIDGTGPAWTGAAVLPGGDVGADGLDGLIARIGRAAPFLEAATVRRLAQSYGSRALAILGDARCAADLGIAFGAGLYEAELRHLVAHEWAATAQDVLWRRSKLGLQLDADASAAVARWIDANIIADGRNSAFNAAP